MAKFTRDWYEYIGISNTTITDGMTPVIEVYMPEFLPNVNGELPHEENKSGTTTCPFDVTCGSYSIMSTRVITVTYLGDANHLVPCVHKGERVRILNYAGTEQYYWTELGRDAGLRRHERIRWFAMAQPTSVKSPEYEDVKDDNAYFIEFNTNPGSKEFHIHTSILEGEHHPYDMHILPEKGMFILRDDILNEIKLWSDEHKWRWENTDGSYIEIDKENITVFCKDTIKMIAGKNIKVFAGDSFSLHAPVHSHTGESRQSMFSTRDWFVAKTHAFDDMNMVQRSKLEYMQHAMNNTVIADINHSITSTTTSHTCATFNNSAKTGVSLVPTSTIVTGIKTEANGIVTIADAITTHLTGVQTSIAGVATYIANHTFTGASFTVATTKGLVPVIIGHGSPAW